MSKELIKQLEDARINIYKVTTYKFCKEILKIPFQTYGRWKKTGHVSDSYKKLINILLSSDKGQSPSRVGLRRTADIAVIGMGCYYPGAPTVRDLWENILARRVQFRRLLDQRLPLSKYYSDDPKDTDKSYLTKAAFIDNFEFDWSKLRIPRKTVESTDISHWLALDVALKTFEDAGYKISEIPLLNTGVIVGNTLTGEQTRSQFMRLRWPYVQEVVYATFTRLGMPPEECKRALIEMEKVYKSPFYPMTEDSLAGGLSNTIAGRICNYLNLKGGGFVVDGACSSSLLAVIAAADALVLGKVDLALAGGVDVSLDPFELVGFSRATALTRDQMRVYDQRAAGFLPGEGCGFVLLKRLEDAVKDKNYIYATLKGWGISSDGKGGMMDPSSNGQALAIKRAYKDLNYKISDVDFIEGHGTGTNKGDKVELEGLSVAMDEALLNKTKESHSCPITSIKSIIGHTKAAAGIAGLIKAVLAVNQNVLPPTASCSDPRDVFNDKAKYLYPLIQGKVLDKNRKLKAGVASAGFGGINCHITLESPSSPKTELKPKIDERALFVSTQQTEVFVFSSRTMLLLRKIIRKFKDDLRNISVAEMADLAALLNKKAKRRLPIKVAIVADSPEHLYDSLNLIEQVIETTDLKEGQIHKFVTKSPNTYIVMSNGVKKGRIGFLYPGQGSQSLNMTRMLVERYTWARDLFKLSKLPLYDLIYKTTDKMFFKNEVAEFEAELTDTRNTQPAIVLSSLIWTEFLSKLGVEPDYVAGHSLGELTAFYKAGAYSKEVLIKFAEFRGSLMSHKGESRAGMAGLLCSRQKAEELLSKVSGNLVIANLNSPNQVVVSGGNKEITKVLELAAQEGLASKRLNVSDAFHSSYMDKASKEVVKSKILPKQFSLNSIGLSSCMAGGLLKQDIDLREYFSKQVVSQVNFIGAVEAISKDCDVLLEVGPGRVLSDLSRAINKDHGPLSLPVESTNENDRDLNTVLAELFIRNIPIKWSSLYENRLIKVFIPASRRKFVINQCEKPLKLGNEILGTEPLLMPELGGDYQVPSEEIIPGGLQPKDGKDSISDLLVEMIAKETGFEKSSISMDFKLEDELRITSIRAAELLGQVTRSLDIVGQIDPAKIGKENLGKICELLSEIVEKRKREGNKSESIHDIFRRYKNNGWVRNFNTKLVNEEIIGRNVNFFRKIKNVVVLSDNLENHFLDELKIHFRGSKAKIQNLRYEETEKIKGEQVDCMISLLPRNDNKIEFNNDVLKKIIDRSFKIVTVAHSKLVAKDALIVFVQFGGGNFGENQNLKDISSSSAKALASTLYLERPDLKVRILDFTPDAEDKFLALKLVDELQTYEQFNAVAYDDGHRKVVYYENSEPSKYQKRQIIWGPKDVILVSGGAKGITAKCALEFARMSKAQMVLVGRSPVPKDEKAEISHVLKQFENEGLKAFYYQCDVTNATDVANKISEIEHKQGRITGFIHGAGLNSLKRLNQANIPEIFNESLPKIMGAVNICRVLSKNPPKLIAAITSIIGVTGMEGSGWYGLSNEVLNLYLHQLKTVCPKTEFVSIAYSIWDEVGMGANLGSIELLSQKGISAIPVDQGVHRFIELTTKDPGCQQIVVSARFTGLPTWKTLPLKQNNFRFLEKVQYTMPGVELIARAKLNIKDDPYLLDHNWRGTLLFPFVFGFEAMAQAVASVLNIEELNGILAQNVELKRTISVPIDSGTSIEIHALNLEHNKIKVEIYSEESGYQEPHFSAIFDLCGKPTSLKSTIQLKRKSNDEGLIDPKIDLYGPILFQGKLFQQIDKVSSLSFNESRKTGDCEFSSFYKKASKVFLKDSDKFKDHFLTGDPFFNDSLLQSMQIVITPNLSLPNFIEEIYIKNVKTNSEELIENHTSVKQINENQFVGSVCSVDERFVVKNCRLMVLEISSVAPTPNDLINPSPRNKKYINDQFIRIERDYGLETPTLEIQNSHEFDKLTKDERHKIELPVIKKAVLELKEKTGLGRKVINIGWSKSGKPQIDDPRYGVSVSHDMDTMICVCGYGPQGCDLESIKGRDGSEWTGILGNEKYKEMQKIRNSTDIDKDTIGTVLWSVYETIKKAYEIEDPEILLINQSANIFIFTFKGMVQNQVIVSLKIKIIGGTERVLTFIANKKVGSLGLVDDRVSVGQFAYDKSNFELKLLSENLDKEVVYSKRFPVTFKHIQNVGKTVYFSNYFNWMGDVREYCLLPIIKEINNILKDGKLGMATNSSSVNIIGELNLDDVVESRLWLKRNYGQFNAVYDLGFEWYKNHEGKSDLVATSQQTISWIKITGHGTAELVRPPELFESFMKLFNKDKLENHQIKSNLKLGRIIQGMQDDFRIRKTLSEFRIQTTQADSNVVGNIYFANYTKWLGDCRDLYLFGKFSKQFTGTGENGEFNCLTCSIDHIGEAMPFDEILVKMYLDKIYENGLAVSFEFLKLKNNKFDQRLAFARQEFVYGKRHGTSSKSIELPMEFIKELINDHK